MFTLQARKPCGNYSESSALNQEPSTSSALSKSPLTEPYRSNESETALQQMPWNGYRSRHTGAPADA